MKITIDLSRENAEKLANFLLCKGDYAMTGALSDHIGKQIEAQLPKPKPEEPKGLGAVVKDDCGDLWTKVDGQWWCSTACGQSFVHFAEIDQPAILSKGVEV